MHVLRILGLTVIVAGLSLAIATASPAQISVNIGPEPVCPYGYYDYAPYPALRMAIMGRSGSTEARSSGPVLGSMVQENFAAM